MFSSFICTFGLLCAFLCGTVNAKVILKDAQSRAQETLQQMTLEEKISMMGGKLGTYEGNTPAVERLGIPGLSLQDGPQGLRTKWKTGGPGTSTSWPSSLTIAASWDRALLNEWATAMAKEFRQKGVNLQLGPGIGIARVPTAGRNWEYLSGEDPYLGAFLVQEVVRGIQSQGVIANAKHFINNEIENHRMTVSANIDERTQFEIYYPPFQGAIDAGVLSLMCSYNRVNDVYACQNDQTLSLHLRQIMGFEGFVVSDWTATKSIVGSLKAGLDIEMPYSLFFNQKTIGEKIADNSLSEEDIDRAVLRILTAMYSIGLVDDPFLGEPKSNATSDAHNALARKIAGQSMVLLKNDPPSSSSSSSSSSPSPLLPLSSQSLGGCIAVIGDETTVTGLGSGSVQGPYIITPAQGIALALSNGNTKVLFSNGTDLSEATSLAAQCETAVVVVATTAREGEDRENLSLGDSQNQLVSSVASVNKRAVVVVNAPGAVLLPWVKEVPSIIVSWLPGQEFGNALADVLFGAVNPSGKLPLTFPNEENEVQMSQRQYPGVGFPPEAFYSEKLLIGYRWYDAKGVEPLFPFGHGLSYCSFRYDDLVLTQSKRSLKDGAVAFKAMKFPNKRGLLLRSDSEEEEGTVLTVSATITNLSTENREGAEVVQLYVSYPKSAQEPPKQLRNFAKLLLPAGQSSSLSFQLKQRDIAIWNSEEQLWEVVPGQYSVFLGASSRDLRLSASFIVA